ncbi:MAG: 50S ribosomal protein L21 [Candidatus Accumulibacter sp.]|nr:50S ribosomal protein L21 [Accumulibacter sp.]
MYAVIKTGGKQYRVVSGEKLKIEQIPAEVGTEITLDQVLMLGEGESVKVGTPVVVSATVKATVLSQRSSRQDPDFQDASPQALAETSGHRQNYTEIRVDLIADGVASLLQPDTREV